MTAAITGLLCVSALMATSPFLSRLIRRAPWALPLLMALLFVLADAGGYMSGSATFRYGAVGAVLLTALLSRDRTRPGSRGLQLSLAALFVYGVVGTSYGRAVLGTQNGAYPFVIPMVVALVGPLRVDTAGINLGLRAVSMLSSCVGITMALAQAGVIGDGPPAFNHEKAFALLLALGAAWAARSKALLALATTAAVIAFLTYPAATYVVSIVVGLLTVLILRRPWGRRGRRILTISAASAVPLALYNIDELLVWFSGYFELVGKGDNSSTRAVLYELALKEVSEAPVFSGFFTGDMTVVTTLSGRTGTVVPIHNDFLELLYGGGIVALLLFEAVIILANVAVMRSLADVDVDARRACVALLGSFDAAVVSAFANPVFMDAATSTLAFAILAATMSIACSCPARHHPSPTVGLKVARAHSSSRYLA